MELSSPLKEIYGSEKLSIFQAQRKAQEIAFGPISFQASRMMKKLGIFKILDSEPDGIELERIIEKTGLSEYAIKVLLEASLSIGSVIVKDNKFFLTKVGWYLLTDKMTNVNMDFVNDVNYKGFFHIQEALLKQKPAGLKELGNFETVYQGLSQLEDDVKESWFNFDHFYSDSSFDEALKIIFSEERSVKKILDVGGNTGRFALKSTDYNNEVEVTVMDLPPQLEMLKKNIANTKNSQRIKTFAANVLKDTQYPEGYDVVWMSQFLDCFSPQEIFFIVNNAKKALNKGGKLFVMETFWDRQKYETASYCLTMTSLYFTVIANGNSKMYHSKDMIEILEKAGYKLNKIYDDLNFGHSILELSAK